MEPGFKEEGEFSFAGVGKRALQASQSAVRRSREHRQAQEPAGTGEPEQRESRLKGRARVVVGPEFTTENSQLYSAA